MGFLLFWDAGAADATGGLVSSIGVHGTGRVLINLFGMSTVIQISGLTQSMGSTYRISADQWKKADYSTLVSAFLSDIPMIIYFDNVGTGTSCSNFATREMATSRFAYLHQ